MIICVLRAPFVSTACMLLWFLCVGFQELSIGPSIYILLCRGKTVALLGGW